MRWRRLISREALSGSLDRFRVIEVGAARSFSKIKASPASVIQLPRLGDASQRLKRNQRSNPNHSPWRVVSYSKIIKLGRQLSRPRLAWHGLMVLGMAAVVLGSQTDGALRAEQLGLWRHPSGFGGVLDTTAAAGVAANVATKTDLLVSAEATKKAQHLNAQVALLTSDDDT